jgi:hypothetical protein
MAPPRFPHTDESELPPLPPRPVPRPDPVAITVTIAGSVFLAGFWLLVIWLLARWTQ